MTPAEIKALKDRLALLAALKKIAATERRNLTPANRLAVIYKIADEAITDAETK